MIKVGVEARALGAKGGGVRRYVEELLRGLKRCTDLDVEVITVNNWPLKNGLLLSRWLNKKVPQELKRLGVDVAHYTKADVPKNKRGPTVVTIYDVIPLLYPQGQKWTRRWYWPKALVRSAEKSDKIITISESSKRDIVRLLAVTADKVAVTPLAADTNFFKPQPEETNNKIRRKYGLKKPYILFVGTIEPRKNVPLLIRAFSLAAAMRPEELVIAGRPDAGWASAQTAARQSGAAERIKFITNVGTEDLPALYSGAELFVWPSVYEGWGFPPQEALACGVPVIVSDGGSLPEVVGKAGEIVRFTTENIRERTEDEHFERVLGERMAAVLGNGEEKKLMAMKGPAQARQFSWDEVTRKTVEVYKQVLARTQ